MHVARRWIRLGAVLGIAVTATAGCSDDPDGLAAGDGFSVEGALAELPVPDGDADGLVSVTIVDLDAAAEANGAGERPDGDDPEAVGRWVIAATGSGGEDAGPTLFVPASETLGGTSAALVDDIEGELGWSILDVEAVAEVAAPPFRFGLVVGDVDAGTLDAEGLTEGEDDVVTAGEGEDGEVQVDSATAARPLGTPLRMAAEDGKLVATTSTAAAAAWRAGEGTDLAEEADDLRAIAAALDDGDAAVAHLVQGDLYSDVGATTELPITLAFTAVGIGWSAAGDITVAYAFADDDAAEDAVAQVEAAYAEDTVGNDGRPVTNRLRLESVEADGSVVVATVEPGRDGTTKTPYDMLISRDVPFTHG